MSEKPTIANALSDLPHVSILALEPFQGGLKELTAREYGKLKKSLLENGVIVPFFVWAETGKLLDGHQRRRVFESEGWQMDVPVVYISADNEQDAKRKLLVISSQYGKVTQEGFDEFTFDLDDEWILDTAHFDALPFVFSGLMPTDPANDANAEWEGMPEFEQEDAFGAVCTIKVHFRTDDDIGHFFDLLGQPMNRVSIWFPVLERVNLKEFVAHEQS